MQLPGPTSPHGVRPHDLVLQLPPTGAFGPVAALHFLGMELPERERMAAIFAVLQLLLL